LTATSITAEAASDDPIEIYESWDESLKEYTYDVCQEKNLSHSLVLAIIYNESRFQAGATHLNTNGTTDWGLMQINDICFDFISERCGISQMSELLDPYVAIECGTELLEYHKDFTQDDSLALLRYQVGAGKYKKLTSSGTYTTSTHTFVMNIVEEYENAFYRNQKLEPETQ